MTAPSRLFNGTVFNFAEAAVAQIVGLAYKTGGNWIDCTEPADPNKLYECSTQPDFAISLKFKGHCQLAYGAIGAASITWRDGTTDACPGTWQVGPIEDTGDWDAPITGTAELRPTSATSEST
jgi:hypothetical protein